MTHDSFIMIYSFISLPKSSRRYRAVRMHSHVYVRVCVCVSVIVRECILMCVCVYMCVCIHVCVFVILMPMRMHSHVWHRADSNIGFNCVTCLICMCTIITHSWVRHDSSMRVTCRIYMSGTEHIPVYWCQNMILFLKNILSKKEI